MGAAGCREDRRAAAGRPVRAGGPDAGETLLELLISIMIVGIGVTAVLGGVGIAARASTQDERQIQAQALLRSWGEHVQARTTDATYTPCATTATYAGAPWAWTAPAPAGLPELPAGFTAAVASVAYWDAPSAGFVAGCTADGGVQRLRLALTADDALYPGFTSTYDVVVRRPCVTLGPGGC